MCLALPARIIEKNDLEAWVQLGDARMHVNLSITPEAELDDWVLVHAGFAIQIVSERDALETWELIAAVDPTSPEVSA